MSYKNYNWEKIANDYNSPYFRNYIFTLAFTRYSELLDLPNLKIGMISRKNAITYVADMGLWQEVHEKIKERTLENYHYVENLIDKTDKKGQEINKWTEKNIFKINLSKLSNKDLFKLVVKFIDLQSAVYARGVALPILDFHDFSFVEGNLRKILEEKVFKNDWQKYFNVFTWPIHNSFAQDQEEDLLKLMSDFYSDVKWQEDVKTKSLEELKKLQPKFYKKLEKHTAKYAWVYYVFSGPAYTEENFLEFIRDYFQRKVDPAKQLKELKFIKEQNKKLKKQYIKKIKPNDFELAIINLAGKVVWAKPRRKDYQSKSYYHMEKLFREIAKRFFISLKQARLIPVETLKEILVEGKKLDVNLPNSVYKFHACLPNEDNSVDLLVGDEARELEKIILSKIKEKDINAKEVTGTTAYPGKVTGIAKIVNQPADMSKMDYGNILISEATTPSIVPAMKKAAAIVTDEGGLTCHASIVSREMQIPCIVGTKIVTSIFKDGDKVEVDAKEGIVRKL